MDERLGTFSLTDLVPLAALAAGLAAPRTTQNVAPTFATFLDLQRRRQAHEAEERSRAATLAERAAQRALSERSLALQEAQAAREAAREQLRRRAASLLPVVSAPVIETAAAPLPPLPGVGPELLGTPPPDREIVTGERAPTRTELLQRLRTLGVPDDVVGAFAEQRFADLFPVAPAVPPAVERARQAFGLEEALAGQGISPENARRAARVVQSLGPQAVSTAIDLVRQPDLRFVATPEAIFAFSPQATQPVGAFPLTRRPTQQIVSDAVTGRLFVVSFGPDQPVQAVPVPGTLARDPVGALGRLSAAAQRLALAQRARGHTVPDTAFGPEVAAVVNAFPPDTASALLEALIPREPSFQQILGEELARRLREAAGEAERTRQPAKPAPGRLRFNPATGVQEFIPDVTAPGG